MELIVLAAGRGRRLRPLTDDRPKPTVQLENDNSILEESINNLQEKFGFDGITIISGYEHDALVDVIKNQINHTEVNIIHNPFYDEAGPIISLWAATHKIWTTDVVIINGDTVYFEDAINSFSKYDHGIHLHYSQTDTSSDDEMKVVSNSNQDKLSKVGKNTSLDWDGVSSGLLCVRGEKYRKLIVNTIHQAITSDVWMTWHNLLNIIQSEQQNVMLKEIPYDSWCEVDTHDDLKAANELI